MTTTERKPIYGERQSDRMYDMYEGREVIDLFVDGVGRMMIGPQVTKMEFFKTTGTKTEAERPDAIVEDRELICRMVIPTPVLAEACGNILSQIGGNIPRLDEGHARLKKLIADAITKVREAKQ